MLRRALPDPLFRRLVRTRELLHDEHAECLDLTRLAEEADLSPYHFLRVFRQAFGETPGRYLTQVRLEQARWHLARGASVTEACFAVGFSSLGSFSALFSREMACSPSEWRRRARVFVQVPGQISRLYVPFCFAQHFGA